MKRLITLIFLFAFISVYSQKTPFEKSEGKETGTYWEVIDYYKQLAEIHSEIRMLTMGRTDSGQPLHLILFDATSTFDLRAARQQGKVVLLINNGIHPGEPDGIEASMMFLRDIATDAEKKERVKNIIIGFIPVYNIGGSLNRNSHTRANQNGPVEYGFRGNAQNLDLNRDFVKMDSQNAWSFADIFTSLNPDVFIDTHVSNGADYQYAITHLATQPDKLGGALGGYMQETMIGKLEKGMEERKTEIIPYVNSFGTTPDQGYGIFFDSPRYSTGYSTLHNTLGFMIETHMLKPFDQRVNSTYNFFESMVDIINEDSRTIISMRKQAADAIYNSQKHTITWNRNREKSRQITFKGFEPSRIESPFSGNRLFYDRNKPFTKEIPYYDRFDPGTEVEIPSAYVIPQGWNKIVGRMMANRIVMKEIKSDSTFEVEAYRIESVDYARGPYEGHWPNRNVKVSKTTKTMTFRKGDYLVPVQQPGIRYVIETLEPEATDSFFSWNFFDTILQQKEYFSSYVFEDIAIELLENDADLKKQFEQWKSEDSKRAENRRAQLHWVYTHSEYYEPAHMNYPIYRVKK